jgi:hypothetical protein
MITARLALVALVALPAVVAAQQSSPVDSGTVVRFQMATGATMRGRLLMPIRPSSPTITYCRYPGVPCRTGDDPGVRTVDGPQVAHVHVADGSHWVRGGVIGGAIGAALGGAAISFANGICDTSDCRATGRRFAATTVALGLGLGIVFGSTSLRWRAAW